MRSCRGGVACVLAMFAPVPARAQQQDAARPVPAGEVPADRGSVGPGGKFVSKDRAAPAGPALSREQAEAALRQAVRVTEEGPDQFRVGRVTFDRKARTVTIPAQVNMRDGVVEYALVTTRGKVHEAVFTTHASADEVHLACLLLGMPPLPGLAVLKPDQAPPAANAVAVDVGWDTNGPPARHPLAALVVLSNNPTVPGDGRPLADGAWLYSGSLTDVGGFAAAREGSLISLITDPAALVNNTRDSAGRDDHHVPNARLLPRQGTPVRIILTLPAKPAG